MFNLSRVESWQARFPGLHPGLFYLTPCGVSDEHVPAHGPRKGQAEQPWETPGEADSQRMSILKGLARVSAKPAGPASPDTATLSPVSESQFHSPPGRFAALGEKPVGKPRLISYNPDITGKEVWFKRRSDRLRLAKW